ncbi:uncharacterized protein LOC126681389 [Mercurialis annua]|uniref:uncharacterized protein LOC126681389 n=1 Tax=Mercurialis annua TaxID=3986 RepID=UPI0024ADAA4F|nr:uncharacterized protein LOC126681389 [Mercurialis annua]
MTEAPCSSEQLPDGDMNDSREEKDGDRAELHFENGVPEGRKEFVPPAVGMEFESYDDAYNYYNCYAKEVGFRVRVKNSWFKRNSREKYGAVLCCSSQGFKRVKDVNRLRKETRTGCPAMIRMRLVDSKRWRVLEIALEHNHLLGAKVYKSIKKMGTGIKRKSVSSSDAEVRTIKLYRALVIDTGGNEHSSANGRELRTYSEAPNQLNLKKGDAQAIYHYLCRMQLTNPNFFYLMDLNDEGHLKNVFWIDARSRAACGYFGDVVYIDNTYLSGKYEIPLVAFVGINHHGQSVLLGCGLLAGETVESYSWLCKTWLTCLSGIMPQTVITDRCKSLQSAIAQAFPRSHHRFGLSLIMKRVPEKLGGLSNYDAIRKALNKVVYETLKVNEFEAAWGFMVNRFGVVDHEWLRLLYEDRLQWAPVYLKETLFVGISAARPGEALSPFFDRYIHKQTPLKEFLDKYELALQKKHKEETLADIESRSSSPMLKTRCSFELQLSKLYTREILKKFQFEVEEMYSCFSTTQIHIDGPIIIFLVKERVMSEGNRREIRDYEVLYNRSAGEVRCICSCFNFYGYLCRHALCVLNFNGVEEIPSKYILLRWKKDYKRLYIPDHGLNQTDGSDRVQWFSQLYRSALQVVEEGVISLDHYSVALQAFEESLNRIHEVEEKQAFQNQGDVQSQIKDSLNKAQIQSLSVLLPRTSMDEASLNTEPIGDDDADGFEIEGDCSMADDAGSIQGENPLPPAVGMEFESYEDVYYFYNCHAKDQGFGVRVSNTWYRKSKERYRGKLSCSSAGFKKRSEANRPRPETRTGCPAMIKFRLMENKRWRIIEVELEHNHLISSGSGKFYKSHKLVGCGTKRTLQLDNPDEVQKVRLYRTVIVDSEGNGGVDNDDNEGRFTNLLHSNQLKLKEGDAQAVQNFFCRVQLMDSDFFYVLDLNEKGFMRNLFWADSRSRVAYSYFGDVLAIDTTCLRDKFEVPLVSFTGVNHHGQSILLGCGLLACEATESYIWLLRAWLTCMLGRPPQAIITDPCTDLQTAVSDVFPRASHCLDLSRILQSVPENLEEIKVALSRTVCCSLRPEDFESAWDEMVHQHGIKDNKWIQSLYEDRKKWIPAYVKETFLAGLFPFPQNEIVTLVFEGYLNKHTSLKDFFDNYDQALQRNHQLEALADMDSKNSISELNSSSYFELQLSKLYSNEIVRRFKKEMEGMYGCFSTRQVSLEGPVVTFIVKEQIESELRDFEVMFNKTDMEILCVCGLFSFRGHLCRHALSVLNQNGVKEIPPQYILTRWRKDVKRSYVIDHSSSGIDVNNPVHRYDHLYRSIVRVVEEGRKSEDRYEVTLQSLEEILNKLHLVQD